MRQNRLFRKIAKQGDRPSVPEDRTHNRPTFDCFPAMLPYPQNFFEMK